MKLVGLTLFLTYIVLSLIIFIWALRYRKPMQTFGVFYLLIYPFINILSIFLISDLGIFKYLKIEMKFSSKVLFYTKTFDEWTSESLLYYAIFYMIYKMGVISNKTRILLFLLSFVGFGIECYWRNYYHVQTEFINLTFVPLFVKSFAIFSSFWYTKKLISSGDILYIRENPYIWVALGFIFEMTINIFYLIDKLNNNATIENVMTLLTIVITEIISLVIFLLAARKYLNWNKYTFLTK